LKRNTSEKLVTALKLLISCARFRVKELSTMKKIRCRKVGKN